VQETLNTAILARFFIVGQAPVELLEDDRYEQTLQFARQNFGSHPARRYVDMSTPARNQFLVHAARAYEDFEQSVLEKIDQLVFHKKDGRAWTTSCSDPLILGLCIRRMSLQYRHFMFHYKAFGPSKFTFLRFTKIGPLPKLTCCVELIPRVNRGRTMYDTMIKLYRHVFRGTLSPFHQDWSLENHTEALGHDEALIERFERVKMAEEKHCDLSTTTDSAVTKSNVMAIGKSALDPEDDALYLRMFLNQQDRKGQSLARAWGIS
jgi:hypothetical protein